ncbi:MAG TPA: calcium/sodium antiporter [bacterium]|jgi:cation:H+ antiporter
MELLKDIIFVLISLGILWVAGNWFVEGAVGVSEKFGLPRMLVGIIIVSLCTTAPELMASLLAALDNKPEVALGNAIGSVIVDDGIALGLAAILAPSAMMVNPGIFRTSAIFLIIIDLLAFFMVYPDHTLDTWEGWVLIGLFAGYVLFTIMREKKRKVMGTGQTAMYESDLKEIEKLIKGKTIIQILGLFGLGVIGVLGGSKLLLNGALGIAEIVGLSPAVTGLTIVAIGTSTPEIVTAIVSAYRGEAGVGIGNIIGADILNVCWVAGLSATVNPLSATRQEILVMFPWMLAIVFAMLIMLSIGYRLSRWQGWVLLLMYGGFLAHSLIMLRI